MHVFLPQPTIEECSLSLDNTRLNSQFNELRMLLNLITGCGTRFGYARLNPPHAALGILFEPHQLFMARLALSHARTLLDRGLVRPKDRGRENTFTIRWTDKIMVMRDRIHFMEDIEMSDAPYPLMGDPDFHSRMRSFLLFKGLMDRTSRYHVAKRYKRWSHILPAKTKDWNQKDYKMVWREFGVPPSWYDRYDWVEKPDLDNLFYRYYDNKPEKYQRTFRQLHKIFIRFYGLWEKPSKGWK